MVAVAGAAAGTAFADSGPVASPPSAPQTQSVSGVAANGVQLSLTVPVQLPLDLPGQQLPERELDVTVKDVGGQGYTGPVTMTLASEGSGASAAALRLDQLDPSSGQWQAEDITAGTASFTVTDNVTVPASGSQVLKLRLSPGTTVVDDVKLSAAANGATAVATMAVTAPGFQASGLTAAARAGAPAMLTAKLTNPTDVDFQHVNVKLMLCSAGSAGCVPHASDVKVEVQLQSGGSWHTVPVADGSATTPMSATVVPDLEVSPGGGLNLAVRVTITAGAFGPGSGPASGATSGSTSASASGSQTPGQPAAPAQPISVPLALGPVGLTLSGQPAVAGTLTVQPPPQQAAPSTPSSSPSTSATSSAPSPTASATPSATDTAGDTSGTAPTSGPTSAPVTSAAAASTPTAASSGSPTVLVAVGLLAVCLALVLWWVLMKRRERLAPVGAAEVHDVPEDVHETVDAEHGHE